MYTEVNKFNVNCLHFIMSAVVFVLLKK